MNLWSPINAGGSEGVNPQKFQKREIYGGVLLKNSGQKRKNIWGAF